jgi:hypothetical protein
MPKRETVQARGGAKQWTDAELQQLVTITPAKLADAKADARRLRPLYAFLRSKEQRGG